MSEPQSKIDPELETYAYAITRRLFNYTLVGTVLFSGAMVAIWYIL